MDEHISYAMRNTEAIGSLIYFNAPGALKDWSFLAIELMLLVGTVTAVLHAMRHHRKTGTWSAVLTLIGCFTYGLLTDITAYYTVENFWHGEFSVMFLYNRLPLYIALFYPAFIYHACMTIRRYGFSPLVEGISVGFYSGLTYLIFDNLGPSLGWWIWDTEDLRTLPYLNAVPVTSYFWFFTFTGSFAFLSRILCWEWPEKGRSGGAILAGGVALPFATYLLGALLFVPFNLFSHSGYMVQAGAFHAVLFASAGAVFFFNYRKPTSRRDALLMIFPLVYLVGLAYLYIAKFSLFFGVGPDGLTEEGLAAGNLIAVVLAIVASSTVLLLSHPVDPRPEG